jgi:hypothetical protein
MIGKESDCNTSGSQLKILKPENDLNNIYGDRTYSTENTLLLH